MATLADQLAHEKMHRDLGRQKMAESLNAAGNQGRITDTPLGTSVLRRFVIPLSARIAEDVTVELGRPGRSKQFAVLLRNMNTDILALLTLDTVLSNAWTEDSGYQVGFTNLCLNLGRTVYAEVALSEFRDINAELYETLVYNLQSRMSKDLRHRMTIFKMQAAKNDIVLPEWGVKERTQVGSYLLSLCEDPELGIINRSTVYRSGKTQYVVELSQGILDIMRDMEGRVMARSAFTAPCLIPPQDWTGQPGEGGFHGDLKIRAPRFFKGTSQQQEIAETLGTDWTTVIEMLNHHQRVAWKVNPFIHSLVKGLIGFGYELEKTVETCDANPPPPRPDFLNYAENLTQAQETEFAAWKATKRDWHTKNKKRISVELRMRLVMAEAEKLIERERFYFVCQADDRYRMYANSGPLNPQGNDLQKALLHAADGEPIDNKEAFDWFRLAVASKYGIDKLHVDKCIQWVDDNHDNIMLAAADPLDRDAFGWWSAADKPLQFIALCDEYRRYQENPAVFRNHIAVPMDGTCNGLQNYSALGRDPVGALATNLISTESGVPNDIYGDVAKAAARRLNAAESPYKAAWLEHGFNRTLTKPSVMTQVYGSTFSTCRKSIVLYCKKNHLFEGEEYEPSVFAGKLVWEGIGDVVVWAKKAMAWLQKCSSLIMAEFGADYISWPSPTGARIVQMYNKQDTLRIMAAVGKKITIDLTAREDNDQPDKIRHRNAISPNTIHGVDAGHMAFVSVDVPRKTHSGVFMHFIHDDFGVLAKHAAQLSRSIREQFVQMHENYSLEVFCKEYPFLPPPPKRGDLDINCVLTSVNFFR